MDCTVIFIIILIIIFIGITILVTLLDIRELKEKEKKYNISKFPVISRMGNKYFAEVVYRENRFTSWIECNIYERVFKNQSKYKDKLLASKKVDFESFDYNFRNVVVRIICKYEQDHETEIKKKRHEEEALTSNRKQFEEWDGIIPDIEIYNEDNK